MYAHIYQDKYLFLMLRVIALISAVKPLVRKGGRENINWYIIHIYKRNRKIKIHLK